MMIEPKAASLYIRDIRKAVILRDLHNTILKILGMCKFPMINNTCFKKQCTTYKSVKI